MRTEGRTTEFLGIEFANLSYGEVALEVDYLSREDSFSYIVTPNVDHVVMLHEGEDETIRERFATSYQAASLRLCDSRVLQLFAKLRGVNLKVVTGSDLTAYLFENGYFNDKKVGIIGGDKAMLAEVRERFSQIDLVQHIPPMGVIENLEAIQEIEAFLASMSCDYVLFAFGAPQSEIIALQCIRANRFRGVGLCVGASIEFMLGRKARAPGWIQKACLEWAFRLATEPRRLWKRYLIVGPRIFRIVLFDGKV